jgi:transposase
MRTDIAKKWRMPDRIWKRMKNLIPHWRPSPKGGRPALDERRVADGIYYVLRTGCQWKAAPREFGSGSSLHAYFQRWTARGVFRKLWKLGLGEYDRRRGIQWRWQTLDASMVKAPLGGEKNRAKSHGSRQVGNQAVHLDGRAWRGDRVGSRSR